MRNPVVAAQRAACFSEPPETRRLRLVHESSRARINRSSGGLFWRRFAPVGCRRTLRLAPTGRTGPRRLRYNRCCGGCSTSVDALGAPYPL